jgi:hypothetical protein
MVAEPRTKLLNGPLDGAQNLERPVHSFREVGAHTAVFRAVDVEEDQQRHLFATIMESPGDLERDESAAGVSSQDKWSLRFDPQDFLQEDFGLMFNPRPARLTFSHVHRIERIKGLVGTQPERKVSIDRPLGTDVWVARKCKSPKR